MITLTLVDLKY